VTYLDSSVALAHFLRKIRVLSEAIWQQPLISSSTEMVARAYSGQVPSPAQR
jgi:hypothetical protein